MKAEQPLLDVDIQILLKPNCGEVVPLMEKYIPQIVKAYNEPEQYRELYQFLCVDEIAYISITKRPYIARELPRTVSNPDKIAALKAKINDPNYRRLDAD